MTKHTRVRRGAVAAVAITLSLTLTGCEWEGLNSLPLPGTEGQGDDAYTVEIQMPNVTTLSQNSPVRVNDVTVGSVTGIDVQDWHALVTVSINGDVQLPANATAKIGQTSLLGSQHLELAPPTDTEPEGRLEDGDVIPIERAGAYPTTEQTLSSLSVVLNGGGIAQIHDITQELNAALGGREDSIRDLLPQLDQLVTSLDQQRGDIIGAMEGARPAGGHRQRAEGHPGRGAGRHPARAGSARHPTAEPHHRAGRGGQAQRHRFPSRGEQRRGTESEPGKPDTGAA